MATQTALPFGGVKKKAARARKRAAKKARTARVTVRGYTRGWPSKRGKR